jgi:hypothetical protein
VLTLPVADGAFKGSMFFTYVGCQTSNVGEVQGSKKGNSLTGTWSGTIDGSPESGPHEGTFDPSAGHYKGTYKVSGGKQFKSIAGCIECPISLWFGRSRPLQRRSRALRNAGPVLPINRVVLENSAWPL